MTQDVFFITATFPKNYCNLEMFGYSQPRDSTIKTNTVHTARYGENIKFTIPSMCYGQAGHQQGHVQHKT